ncbi:beta-phosphoglucomutase [Undibacterium sp. GrIS 1.8]|uniref:HAD family hydrolase n=1 Tax=Undibacterium sp. GrIS 1.8 TaxID=3143934 RepID=UPI003395A144
MIKAVIFDMDGVLIEAKEWHYDALNRALRLFGYEISRFSHLTTYDGLPTSKKLAMLSLERGLPSELHSFINEMKQVYTMEMVYAQCKPRFVHEYALSTLKSKGYKLGVASNSIRNTVEVMMDKARLTPYLDQIVSASDVTLPKPDPEIYLTSIAKLGLTPNECLIVEDNDNGIKAAMASGAHVLVVKDVNEVNLENILKRIKQIEGAN